MNLSPLLKYSCNAPASIQLARVLTAEIQTGKLAPGEKIPSVRRIAERFGVGRQVVLSAFGLLMKQNLVRSEARRGYYVNPNIRKGLYYRIGFFNNRCNPARSIEANRLYFAAAKYGFQLIAGSNFEEDFELDDWLARKKDLDGVIISGTVDDTVLKGVAAGCLPYVVMGNYDLSPNHPQVKNHEYAPQVGKQLAEILSSRGFRTAVVMLGPSFFYNEKFFADALRREMAVNGFGAEDVGVFYAKDDGYPELCKIMRGEPPDAIVFIGEHCLAWRKYCEQNPNFAKKQPFIVINGNWKNALHRNEYNLCMRVQTNENMEEAAVLALLKKLKNPVIYET